MEGDQLKNKQFSTLLSAAKQNENVKDNKMSLCVQQKQQQWQQLFDFDFAASTVTVGKLREEKREMKKKTIENNV